MPLLRLLVPRTDSTSPLRVGRMLRRAYAVVALGLFALLVHQFWQVLHDRRVPVELPGAVFFGSDVLYGAALYEDLIVDGYSLKTFQFSAATFWVPDVLIYFVWRTILGQVAPAVWATVASLFLLHIAAAVRFGRAVVGPAAARFVAPMLLLAAGIYLAGSGLNWFQHHAEREFYLPGYHCGATLCAFFALASVVYAVRSPSRWALAGWHLAAVAGVTAVSAFSDRLFGIWFVGPVAIGLVGLKLLGGDSGFTVTWRKLLTLGLAVGLGTAAGMAALKWFQTTAGDPISNYWVGPQWDVFVRQLKLFVKLIAREIRGGNWLLASCVAWHLWAAVNVTSTIVRRVVFRQKATDGPMLFFRIVCIAAAVANVLVFLLSKTAEAYLAVLDWGDLSRYFAGPISFAFFGWFIVLAQIAGRGVTRSAREAAAALPVALAVGVLVAMLGNSPDSEPDRELVNYYPKYVEELDAVCRKHDLHDGLAAYAVAKQTTLLSRAGVKLRQIEAVDKAPHGFTALHWLSNSEYYWQPPRGRAAPVKFEFIVVHPTLPGMPRSEDVVATFGEPAIRERAGPYGVFIYNRPEDFKLHRFAELDGRCLVLKATRDGWDRVQFPGGSFWGRPPHANAPDWHDRVATEGTVTPGILAFGPYLDRLKPGHYRVTFRTSTTGVTDSNGALDVMYSDLSKGFETVVAVEQCPVGTNRKTAMTVYVPNSAKQPRIEFRTFYNGHGTLTLHDVTVERLPPAPRQSR